MKYVDHRNDPFYWFFPFETNFGIDIHKMVAGEQLGPKWLQLKAHLQELSELNRCEIVSASLTWMLVHLKEESDLMMIKLEYIE